MRLTTKSFLAAVGALLFCAAPAMANAERVYYLVGMRHVYRVGSDMYAHVAERKQIEQDYADQVAADNDTYQKAVSGGADSAKETADLNNALADLAAERDSKLAAIYTNADNERDLHPELKIEADGPYQVIGINFHRQADVEVVDNYAAYAPWPGYAGVDPYGWDYGVFYSPFAFGDIYLGWHSRWFGLGCPAFLGFYGSFGPVFIGGFSWGGHGEIVRGFGGGGFGRGGFGGRSTFGRYSGGLRSVIGNGGSRFNSASRSSSASRFGGSPRSNSSASRYSSSASRGISGSRYSSSALRNGAGSSRSSAGQSRYNSGRSSFSSTRPSSGSRSSFSSGRSSFSSGRSSYSRSGSSFGSGRSSGSFGGGRSSGGSSHSSGGSSHSGGGSSHRSGKG